ncbi:type II toxin-antitoxin system death-on-curing family toxin [Hyphobacterium sp.]|uniref:type II toxin-antitoxin system death-on-curing family toxin n=1 Tax=Hyphobacterium sp. TaxID=2004662 RepID=UPI003BAD7687
MSRIWLTLEDVLDIHARQIAEFGGSNGLRDAGALEAALFRPRSGYYDDLIAEAAALWESLSHNHAFIDGNKRTALASTIIFLGLNGVELTATPDALMDFLLPLYEKQQLEFNTLEAWLRENTRAV